jgi:hypothetical protein
MGAEPHEQSEDCEEGGWSKRWPEKGGARGVAGWSRGRAELARRADT